MICSVGVTVSLFLLIEFQLLDYIKYFDLSKGNVLDSEYEKSLFFLKIIGIHSYAKEDCRVIVVFHSLQLSKSLV